MSRALTLNAERLLVADSPEAINQMFAERGWGDGLPIVPPTAERVRQMLAFSDRDPQEVIAEIPPAWGPATVEYIAINAVMAGCRPQCLPVLIAAVSAMPAPELNLYGIQATTHSCGLFLLVNGPIAKELGLNGSAGAFGPGNVANATIGRAIRLILMNIGGALPGTTDKSTQGQPCKYTYCVAENEDDNPWSPFHVDQGFVATTSTVSIVGAEGPHNINDHGSTRAEGILFTTANTMAVLGANNAYCESDLFVAFGPEHAAIIAGDGFSKHDVQKYIFRNAHIPFSTWQKGGNYSLVGLPADFDRTEGAMVRLVPRPEDIHVVVVGGAGRHSCFIPTFGATRTITAPIALRDGRPARSVHEFQLE